MHCPSCGNESSLDQKFCRKCGFGLEPISKLVGQNRSEDRLEIDKAERERLIVRHMFRWLALGLLVIGLAVLMLVTNKNFDIGKFFGWAASLVLLIGTGMATYGVISAIGKGTSLPNKSVREEGELTGVGITNELPGAGIPVPVPSVTERTTRLIATAKPEVKE